MWYQYLDINLMEEWLGTGVRFDTGDKDPFVSSLRTASRIFDALSGHAQSRDSQQKTDLRKAQLWETKLAEVFLEKAHRYISQISSEADKGLYLNLLLLSEALHTRVVKYKYICNFWHTVSKHLSFQQLKENLQASYLISYLSVSRGTKNYCPLESLAKNNVISELDAFRVQDLDNIPGTPTAKIQWQKLKERIIDSSTRTDRDGMFTAMEILFSIRQEATLKKYCTPSNIHILSSLLEDYAADACFTYNHLLSTPNETMHAIPHQLIFFGAPGTGKSHAIKKLTEGHTVIRTTFHPESDYASFVGAYKPVSNEREQYSLTADGQTVRLVSPDDPSSPIKRPNIEYKFVKQAFLKAYIQAWQEFAKADTIAKPVFLIIEELNRGNCSQIFGDLFQLLDRREGFSEYPIAADEDLAQALREPGGAPSESFGERGLQLTEVQKLQINNLYSTMSDREDVAEQLSQGNLLILPSNLFILATMNTSDQSLYPMDSAFKRRWEWKYIPIRNAPHIAWQIHIDYTDDKGVPQVRDYSWWKFLQAVNIQIEQITHSEDKKLGYFFCKPLPGSDTISAETFVGKVVFYLWDDVFKTSFQRESFFSCDGKAVTYKDFYKTEATDEGDEVVSLDSNTIIAFIDSIVRPDHA